MSAIDTSAGAVRARMTDVRPEGGATVDAYARAIWSVLIEPGDGAAGALIQAEGAAPALTRAIADIGGERPRRCDPYSAGLTRWAPRLSDTAVVTALRVAARHRIRLVVPGDEEWPAQLDDLGVHAPAALWVRGDPSLLSRLRPSVAIVGARAATSYGEYVATELAADLALSGIPIVSGAAFGIDGAAHRAALAAGGTTVALLAGGPEKPYPSGNADVIEQMFRDGAVASEVPCGSAPTKWRFLQRNRLIAALADATVVVEASHRSGSLNTAGHAAALGRALGAVPGPITSAASAGCHRMLREFGAQCVTDGADVRELLGIAPEVRSDEGEGRPPTDAVTRVRDAMSVNATRTTEDIARRSGMAVDEVEGRLGLLRLTGEAEEGVGGWRLRPRVRG